MSDAAWHEEQTGAPSHFYLCLQAETCGLRFPVVPGDRFSDKCPRCGSTVRMVGSTPADDAPTLSLPDAPQQQSQIHLLLDNWRSLFNVGAAFRTADGAGLRHLYLCGITAAPDSQRKLAKTAWGAERSVAWSYHPNAVQLAHALQAQNKALWVLERGQHSQSLFDISDLDVAKPVVLVAGNERAGVDPELLAMAARVIHVPMVGQKASLNVAVAMSVAAYWLRAHESATLQPPVWSDSA